MCFASFCKNCSLFLLIVVPFLPLLIDRIPMMTGMFPFLHFTTPFGFIAEEIPDLSGKTILVTGANAGLGFDTVRHLARNNAEVILACRNMKKGNVAMEKIKEEMPNAKLHLLQLDLGNLASVEAFAKKVNKQFKSLDSLILNAGIMMTPYSLSDDGLQLQFAVNHLGHFYLTKMLLDLVVKSGPSTIVSLSSAGHFSAELPLYMTPKDLNDKDKYMPDQHYAQSKLFNIYFVSKLNSRLKAGGVNNVHVNVVHPGFVRTELGRHFHTVVGEGIGLALFELINNSIAWGTEEASLTSVYAAVSPKVFNEKITNKYFHPIARETSRSWLAEREDLANELWDISERYITQFQNGESLTDEKLDQ